MKITNEQWEAIANHLFEILDDIDTVSDMAPRQS